MNGGHAEAGASLPGPAEIRVFILGDVRLYREGLTQALERAGGVCAVGAAGLIGLEAAIREVQPEVVLIDISAVDGLAAIRAVTDAAPGARIVALSAPTATDDVVAFGEAGVVAYVPREGSLAELVAILRGVHRGEAFLPPVFAAKILERLRSRVITDGLAQPTEPLTMRELEIVELIRDGLSNKEIARELGIALATVKNHVHNILGKLRLSRRIEVATRAEGLLPRSSTGVGPRAAAAARGSRMRQI